jgi:pimeloyl-ACP methyl ester carboxylesterase
MPKEVTHKQAENIALNQSSEGHPSEGHPVKNVAYKKAELAHVNGIKINFDYFGQPSNPPIILTMGLGVQMIYWHDAFCQMLAQQGYWVIRYDNRDIGKSTWLDDLSAPNMWDFISNTLFRKKVKAPYKLDDMAADLLALMDYLHIDKAHLVGASMGGMISQCAALIAPERVSSLTSIMSTTGDRSLPTPKASVSAKLLKPMPRELEKYVARGLEVWQILHHDHYPFDAENIEHLLRTSYQRGFNPKGVARQLAAIMASPARTNVLSQLKMPCLIIHGDSDPLLPLECGLATARAIGHAKMSVLEGMGHTFPQTLWPRIVNDIVDITQAKQP